MFPCPLVPTFAQKKLYYVQCSVIGLGTQVRGLFSVFFPAEALFWVVVAKYVEGSFIQRNFPYKRLLIF